MSTAKILAIRIARNGAAEAQPAEFEQLLRPHFARMYRVALHFTRSVPDAEDLLQDVLISLYERRDKLVEIDDLESWLARVIHNRFVDHRRSALRRLVTTTFKPRDSRDEESILDQIRSDDPGPEERAIRAERVRQLQQVLGRLNDEQRIAVMLHDVEGFSLEEIAEITSAPIGSVKLRLHRGRAKLRLLLGQGTFLA